MPTTNVNIRMDTELKKKFEAFCSDVGITMTAAINIFAKRTVRENRIPFEVTGDIPNSETREAIQEVQRMKADPTMGKTYTDVDQMMKEILSDEVQCQTNL